MFVLIALLTLVMVLDCFILIFLVLIQLPKKEAGAGLAFGGAATDALFGAGSGTVLTKVTKYAATIFFLVAIILAVLQSRYHNRTTSKLEQRFSQPGATTPSPLAPGATPETAPSPGTPAATPPNVRTSISAQASDVPLSPTNVTAPTSTAPVPQK